MPKGAMSADLMLILTFLYALAWMISFTCTCSVIILFHHIEKLQVLAQCCEKMLTSEMHIRQASRWYEIFS